jgi:hypothetical protein
LIDDRRRDIAGRLAHAIQPLLCGHGSPDVCR